MDHGDALHSLKEAKSKSLASVGVPLLLCVWCGPVYARAVLCGWVWVPQDARRELSVKLGLGSLCFVSSDKPGTAWISQADVLRASTRTHRIDSNNHVALTAS